MHYLIGITLFILGIIQLTYIRHAFKELQVHGRKNTSTFTIYVYWISAVIGVLLMGCGLGIGFGID